MHQRSQEKELLDLGSEYYTPEEYNHCLKMLFRVNQIFGVFSSTKNVLKRFSKTASLLDIGCGGGLFLLHLNKCFPDMLFKGIDISPEAIVCAQQEQERWKKDTSNVSFQLQAQPTLDMPENSFDIILATFVCHHLTDDELVVFLRTTLQVASKAVIINDLQRHSIAHWFYGLISPFLFRNRLITHDGLISIRRGFTRMDWKSLLQKAGIHQYKIKWCFPFRWRVILWKKL